MKILTKFLSWFAQKFKSAKLKGKFAIIAGVLLFISVYLTSCLPNSNNNDASQSDMTAAFETAQVELWEGITQTVEASIPEPTATVEPSPTAEPTYTLEPLPTATLVQTIALPQNVASCVPQNTKREEGLVVGIVDGDTIDVQINDNIYRVNYIGVDAPKVDDLYYWQTLGENQELVYSKQVVLVEDVTDIDTNNQYPRYVFIGNTFVNHELIAQGFASFANTPPDTACNSTFQTIEQQAKTSKLGFWAPPPTLVPIPTQAISSGSGGSSSGGYCCKVCTTGKACGDSCISRNYTCHKPPGCACDG